MIMVRLTQGLPNMKTKRSPPIPFYQAREISSGQAVARRRRLRLGISRSTRYHGKMCPTFLSCSFWLFQREVLPDPIGVGGRQVLCLLGLARPFGTSQPRGSPRGGTEEEEEEEEDEDHEQSEAQKTRPRK